MATPEQATRILDRLNKELDHRHADTEKFNKAYDGDFKLHFASDEFDEYFASRYANFSDNWTAVVADAPHERLEVTGIRLAGSERGDDKLWRRWVENEADAYSDMAFLDAIIAKRSFALVWGDPAVITFEHPSQAIVDYDPETRGRRAAAKIWADEKTIYATLYLPDEVWKFQRPKTSEGRTDSGLYVVGLESGWEQRQVQDEEWPLPNPMGVVPMVELANRPRLMHDPVSDIAGTQAMQHAINLLWAQLFTASDAASFPQRIILGADIPTIPILDSEGQETGAEREIDLKKWSMKRAQWIEDPTAKIAEWKAADLEVWTKVIDKAVGHISAQSRTPATYFLGAAGSISNISGDTMKALETGLVKRTEEKTQHFGRSVREIFRLVAIAEGAGKKKLAAIAAGTTLWRDVENRSEAQRADALSKKREIGYPMRYLLELDGLSPTEVDRVMGMISEEQQDPYLAGLDVKDGADADADAPSDSE